MARCWNKSESGYSLLEQAVVLPIVLVLVFGAIDINTLLQGYSALKQGVGVALRCVYTVDGNCVAASPSSAQPLFTWYQNCSQGIPQVDQVNFNGRASWIEFPTYSYPAPSAYVLSDVRFTLPNASFINEYQLENEATYRYVIKTADKPYLVGSDGRNPSFRFAENRNRSYPVARTLSTSARVNRTNRTARVGPFRIRSPFTDPPQCFRATNASFERGLSAGSPAIEPAFSRDCGSFRRTTSAVLWLQGRKAVDAGTSGGVTLTLSGPGGKSLGGQSFGPGHEPSNFVPRGVGSDHADMDNPEIGVHHDVELEYGEDYYLDLELVGDTGVGSVEWSASELVIFTSQYSTAREAALPCANRITQTQLSALGHAAQIAACAPTGKPAEVNLAGVRPKSPQAVPAELWNLSYQGVSGTEQNLARISQTLTQRGLPADLARFYLITQDGDGFSAHTSSCPAIAQGGNFGVSDAAGSDGRIRNSAQALAICPPQVPPGSDAASAQDISWGESLRAVPIGPVPSVERPDCTSPLSVPASLSMYHKLQLGSPEVTYSPLSALGFDSQRTPAWYKQNDTRYACSELRLASREFNEHAVPRPSSDSLFVGTHDNLGACTESRLRDEAVRQGMSALAYFEPQVSIVGARQGSITDSCSTYRVVSGEATETRLAGAPSNAQPAACLLPGACQCRGEFAGYSSGVPVQITFDQATAQRAGFDAAHAAFPRAKSGCDSENCLNVEVSVDEGAAGHSLHASANLNVPVRLLLGRTVNLSYADSRSWEGDLGSR